ncbi:MAG TPA: amidohydrolase family protein [Chloroflexota bacterium]|nr:amidohydrolase family protein [Chloroflexota bacterium]
MAIGGTRVVALEEHYWDPDVIKHYGGPGRDAELQRRLLDLGELRIREMDEAGIDFQVISHANPGVQRMDAATAVPLARQANDGLAELISAYPDRLAGFATLPTPDPAAAADELERTVAELGFKGAMVNGPTNGVFFDDRHFWPICERAQALDVPIYLHPAAPHPAVVDAYYRDYLGDFPALSAAAWGFMVETATEAIRLILSGMFDAYPNLKVILGHMGEAVPFALWRIDHSLSRPGNKPIRFREQFCSHFYVTTSGFFSTPALQCCLLEMGVDRVLFSVDYPFEENAPGTRWFEHVQVSPDDREKILNGNASRLLKLG